MKEQMDTAERLWSHLTRCLLKVQWFIFQLLFAQLTSINCFVFSPPIKRRGRVCVRRPLAKLFSAVSRAEVTCLRRNINPFFSRPPPLDSFLLTKSQHRNEEQKSCMGQGGGGCKECIEPPSFTVTFFSRLGRVLDITGGEARWTI